MKKLSCILLSLVLVGCVNTPKNPQSWMEFQQNACVPTAVVYKRNLEKQNIWSKVIIYSYKHQSMGHAIATYMYPPGENQLWTYDYLGSYRARAYNDNPLQIAREAERARNRNPDKVKHANFVD
jgi:hypothetical protein